jgi:hypothetical protein
VSEWEREKDKRRDRESLRGVQGNKQAIPKQDLKRLKRDRKTSMSVNFSWGVCKKHISLSKTLSQSETIEGE